MKILTKDWMEQYEQVRVINWLKEVDLKNISYEEMQKMSRDKFYDMICDDRELVKLAFGSNLADELYQAQIERDKKAVLNLPKVIYSKIIDVKSVILGYASKQDKQTLMTYADELYAKLENQAEKANKITENAKTYLPEQFDFDFLMGEFAYEEYVDGKNYFIVVHGYTICVENYEIIERENFEINKFDMDNPVSLWTSLDAMELHHVKDDCFELHLLFANGDSFENKTFWYFTLKGTNVKFVEKN